MSWKKFGPTRMAALRTGFFNPAISAYYYKLHCGTFVFIFEGSVGESFSFSTAQNVSSARTAWVNRTHLDMRWKNLNSIAEAVKALMVLGR